MQALDFGGVALAEGGIAKGVAQLHLELAVEHFFVGVAALGGKDVPDASGCDWSITRISGRFGTR